MRRLTIEHDEIKLRFTKRESEPFKWDQEVWHDDHWIPLPDAPCDATDLLWQCAGTIGPGQFQ